jgi:hypothetical protein
MAKGKSRAGREPKKPKQVKKPDTVASVFGGASPGTRAAAARGTGK